MRPGASSTSSWLGVLVEAGTPIAALCLLDKHHSQKGPLNDNGFPPSFSRGFLYTPETSTLRSWSRTDPNPGRATAGHAVGVALVRKVPAPRARWRAPSPSSAGAQTHRAT